MSFSSLCLIAIVTLVAFGPKQLPILARDVGRFVKQCQRLFAALKFELERPLREQQLQENIAKAEAVEKFRCTEESLDER